MSPNVETESMMDGKLVMIKIQTALMDAHFQLALLNKELFVLDLE